MRERDYIKEDYPPGRAKFLQKNKKKILKTDTTFFASSDVCPRNLALPLLLPQIIAAGRRKSLKTLPHDFLLITRMNFLNVFGALKYIREKDEEERQLLQRLGPRPQSRAAIDWCKYRGCPHFALLRALRNVPMVITGDAWLFHPPPLPSCAPGTQSGRCVVLKGGD